MKRKVHIELMNFVESMEEIVKILRLVQMGKFVARPKF